MDINFSTGDAIEVTRDNRKYRTVVERQIDHESILIYSPIEKGHVLPVREGEQLELVFVVLDPENNKYDVYSFMTVVVARQVQDSIPMLMVRSLSKPKKVQRRDFYRLNIVKSILIESITDDSTIEVITQDISAGGMQAISPKQLNVGSEYLVYMNIFTDFPIVLSAKILSSDPRDSEYTKYVNRFYFTNIDKKVQSEMIRQINHLQVLEIRRRKMNSPGYKASIKSYLDDELLDRYNLDKKVDSRIRYLTFFNIFVALVSFAIFVMAMPNTDWMPLFGSQPHHSWNKPLLKLDIFVLTLLFLTSSFGLVYDRMHYNNRRSINLFFVIMLIISVVVLLGFVIFAV